MSHLCVNFDYILIGFLQTNVKKLFCETHFVCASCTQYQLLMFLVGIRNTTVGKFTSHVTLYFLASELTMRLRLM
jgi:hypothetical protein